MYTLQRNGRVKSYPREKIYLKIKLKCDIAIESLRTRRRNNGPRMGKYTLNRYSLEVDCVHLVLNIRESKPLYVKFTKLPMSESKACVYPRLIKNISSK